MMSLLATLLMLLNSSAIGQTLALPDVGAGPPTLVQPSYAADLIKELEGEIASMLDGSRDADQNQKTIARASINCRRIAANLLAFSDRAGPNGSIAMLAGVRLAQGRQELDHSIARARDLAPAESEPVLNSIASFNEDADSVLADGRAFMDGDLDLVLQKTFRRLAEAISALEETPVVSHWPSARHAPAAATEPALADLAASVQQAPLPAEAHEELISIVDFLQRGEEFPELKPRIELYGALVSDIVDAAAAFSKAAWLSDDDRAAFDARIAQAVALFKDPKTRETGQKQIARLNASRIVIDRIDALTAEHAEVKAIAKAYLAAESSADDPGGEESGRQQIGAIDGVLERMLAYRNLPDPHLKRELRIVERDLHKAYRTAEEALVKQIGSLTTSSRPLADPAITSLLMEQKQLLADLQRIAKVPAWIDAMAAIDKTAAEPFEKQAVKMGRGLLDPNRRPDSVAAMSELERQLGMFIELPFEAHLRDGDASAASATGAMHAQLLALIKQQRQKWAQAWGDGGATSAAAGRLAQLHRLTSAMADMAQITQSGGGGDDADVLNRWSAWMLDPVLFRRPMADVASRLKLATAAAVQGDDNGLNQQLEKIDRDAPLVKLVGRLTAMLGDSLRELPAGATGIMGELSSPPGSDARLLQQRRAVADICRYAMEQEHARAAGRAESAVALNDFVTAASKQLLIELGEYDGATGRH